MTEATHPDSTLRTSPLAAFRERLSAASVAEPRGIALEELPYLAQIDLRGDAGDPLFRRAVRRALDLDLPTLPNTVTTAGAMRVLWLGPDEWLLVGDPGAEERSLSRLDEALARLRGSAVDVGANRTVLSISGSASRSLLMKGCGLDLHPRAFSRQHCAQTNFARTTIILEQTDDTPAWRIYARSSFAPYLANWLIDAAREYLISRN
jgi:sarcosine oxidase subunit gamma